MASNKETTLADKIKELRAEKRMYQGVRPNGRCLWYAYLEREKVCSVARAREKARCGTRDRCRRACTSQTRGPEAVNVIQNNPFAVGVPALGEESHARAVGELQKQVEKMSQEGES